MNLFHIDPWETEDALDSMQSTACCEVCDYQDTTESGIEYHNGAITCPNCEDNIIVSDWGQFGDWS
jgi:hypothetical protein